MNPTFGFLPRHELKNASGPPPLSPLLVFFMSPLEPAWCRGESFSTILIAEGGRWVLRGDVKKADAFTLAVNYPVLIDSGSGLLGLPEWMFESFRDHVLSLGIPELDFSDTFPTIPCDYLSRFPHFEIYTSNNVKIIIPPEAFTSTSSSGICTLFVKKKRINQGNITIGEPWFRLFATGINSANRAVSIWEPKVEGDAYASDVPKISQSKVDSDGKNVPKSAGSTDMTIAGAYLALLILFKCIWAIYL